MQMYIAKFVVETEILVRFFVFLELRELFGLLIILGWSDVNNKMMKSERVVKLKHKHKHTQRIRNNIFHFCFDLFSFVAC